ncbi:MAG: S8 family serine peptidase, partial [Candidatus Heimdallarchaeota archaeon]|nr:S8 family serine peptidase [Candidatus Heimdallarchaeota archaeon]
MKIRQKSLIISSCLIGMIILTPLLTNILSVNLSENRNQKRKALSFEESPAKKIEDSIETKREKNKPAAAAFIHLPKDNQSCDFFIQFKSQKDFSDFLLSGLTFHSTFKELNSAIISNISSSLLREKINPFTVNYLAPFRNTKLTIQNTGSDQLTSLTDKERREGETMAPQSLSVLQAINGSNLWNQGYKGAGMKIAILDTGINEEHVDFKGRISAKYSFVRTEFGYSSEELTIEDNEGHGSHVAGIAAGNGTANNEYTGIAPEAELIIAKVAGQDGVATLEGIIAAFNWAVAEDADVINLSFGGEDYPTSSPFHTILEMVVEGGTIVTISTGNEG